MKAITHPKQRETRRPKLNKKQRRYILDNTAEFKRVFIGWRLIELYEVVKDMPGVTAPELADVFKKTYERTCINLKRLEDKGWIRRDKSETPYTCHPIKLKTMQWLLYKYYYKHSGRTVTVEQLTLLKYIDKYGPCVNEDLKHLYPDTPTNYINQRLRVLGYGGWLKWSYLDEEGQPAFKKKWEIAC